LLQRRVQCETIRSRKREDKPAAEVRRSVPQILQRAMIEVLKAMYEEDFPWVAPELFGVVQARPRSAAKWGGRGLEPLRPNGLRKSRVMQRLASGRD
jgi:hypothetical protein